MAADSWQEYVTNNLLPRMEANGPVLEPGPTNPQPFSTGVSLTPSFDVIEILPPAAQEKLRLLRQRSADAHSIIPPFEDVRAASMAKIDATNTLRRLTDHPQNFGRGLSQTDPTVVTAEKYLNKMSAEFRRLTELQEVRTAAWHLASGALAAVEGYLRHNVPGNCTLEDAEKVEPKLSKNETVLDGVERLRRRVRELRADLHRIASAPVPSGFAKAQMRAQVEALAMQGAPIVSDLVEHRDGKIIWPEQRVRSEVFAEHRALAFHQATDALALFAWLHKDALIAALDREISTEADDEAALTHEARQKAEAEVQGDLLDIERQEASLTWRAQAENLPIEHRADISPLALLAVRLVTTPRADVPGTDVDHAYSVIPAGLR